MKPEREERLIYWMKQFYYKYQVYLGIDFVKDMISHLENNCNRDNIYNYHRDNKYNNISRHLEKSRTYNCIYITNIRISEMIHIPKTILVLKTKDMQVYRRESFLYRVKMRKMCIEFQSEFEYELYPEERVKDNIFWNKKKIVNLMKLYRKNELKYRQEENTIFNLIQLLRKTSLPNDIIEYHIKPYLQRERLK